MADSCSSVDSSICSLCKGCSRIFQGHHFLDHTSVLMPKPAVNLIQAESCRVCSVIRSRHNRFIEHAARFGETPNLLEIKYLLLKPGDSKDDGPKIPPFELRLELHYANDEPEYIKFTAVPTNCG
jgi:hypothetical protein